MSATNGHAPGRDALRGLLLERLRAGNAAETGGLGDLAPLHEMLRARLSAEDPEALAAIQADPRAAEEVSDEEVVNSILRLVTEDPEAAALVLTEPNPPPSETAVNGLAAAPEGRTAGGKFAKGNKLAKGNPFARKLGKMRSAFLKAVTDDDVQAVARKLRDLASAGDVAAIKLFLSYVVGKPGKAVNPDRLDLDEYRLLEANPTVYEALRAALDGVTPRNALAMLRLLQLRGEEADRRRVFAAGRGRDNIPVMNTERKHRCAHKPDPE